MNDSERSDPISEEERKKVGVQIYIDEDVLAELKDVTMCDINTQAVMVAVRTLIRNAKANAKET